MFPLVTVTVRLGTDVSSSVMARGMDKGGLGVMAQVSAAKLTATLATAPIMGASFSTVGVVVRVVVSMVAVPLLMTRVTVTAEGTAPVH